VEAFTYTLKTLEPATTFLNMPREKIVALNIDHDGLCQLTAATDQVHHEVVLWFEEVTSTAHQRVMSRIRRGEYSVPHLHRASTEPEAISD